MIYELVGGPLDGQFRDCGNATVALTSDENALIQYCYYAQGNQMIYWGTDEKAFFKFLGRHLKLKRHNERER